MEAPLENKDQWTILDPSIEPTRMSVKYLEKMDQKEKSTIRLCLSYSILLNVSREAITKELWDKLGDFYLSKSLVNKMFPWKKLYNLRMKYGDLVTKHLNSFNIVVSQLLSIDIKISYQYKCNRLLLFLPDSWGGLVVAIGSNETTLKFCVVVWLSTDDLFARGHSQERNRSKSSSEISC
jgi:hypothetical protein